MISRLALINTFVMNAMEIMCTVYNQVTQHAA